MVPSPPMLSTKLKMTTVLKSLSSVKDMGGTGLPGRRAGCGLTDVDSTRTQHLASRQKQQKLGSLRGVVPQVNGSLLLTKAKACSRETTQLFWMADVNHHKASYSGDLWWGSLRSIFQHACIHSFIYSHLSCAGGPRS